MTIIRDPLRCKLKIKGAVIEEINDFNYLGALITSNRRLQSEAKSQPQKAARKQDAQIYIGKTNI